jgi:hypothetical protein
MQREHYICLAASGTAKIPVPEEVREIDGRPVALVALASLQMPILSKTIVAEADACGTAAVDMPRGSGVVAAHLQIAVRDARSVALVSGSVAVVALVAIVTERGDR